MTTKPPAAAPQVSPPQTPPLERKQERSEVAEIGGPPGPEPTRYGDWERNGRCVDF